MLFRDMQIAAGGCTDSIGDERVGAVNLFQISRVETDNNADLMCTSRGQENSQYNIDQYSCAA